MNGYWYRLRRPLVATVLFIALFFLVFLPTTVYAACSDPPAPGVDWTGCDKSNVNLKDLDLTGAILVGTNLSGASLNGAILTGANLTGANLQGVKAQGTDFSNANLSNTNVANVDFKSATLLGATGTVINGDLASLNNTTCPSGNIVPPGACWSPAAITLQGVNISSTYPDPFSYLLFILLLSVSGFTLIRYLRRCGMGRNC